MSAIELHARRTQHYAARAAHALAELQAFAASRVAGALIVVDPASHRTSGALLVKELA